MNELFHSTPYLYILGLTLLAGCLFRYVWNHEKALADKYKRDNYRPFK